MTKLKTALMATAAAGTMALGATPAAASIIELGVSDATGGNCSHGLWTNTLRSGCAKKFSFQDGTVFTQNTDNGTATFTGTALNNQGEVATLDLMFSQFQDELFNGQDYKAGGGAYNPATMDFYSNASGTIKIGDAVYTLKPSDPLAGNTTLQIGPGANDKTSDFGGSAWLNILNPSHHSIPHWDINFDLTHMPTAVPAPAGMALFGLALMGLWAGRRRKTVRA
ncbi:MAG: PEP-CTERM sorting domain-containing protein [Parerythrobacter sp.]